MIIRSVVFLFGVLLCASMAWAGSYEITATWEMDPPTDLAGFQLRLNGNEVIDIPDAEARSWAGMRELNDDNNIFELQTLDAAGQISGWTEPVNFDPPPNKGALSIMILQ